MGVSIHPVWYDLEECIQFIDEHRNAELERPLSPREFVEQQFPKFGEILDGRLHTVYNEYYEEYNPVHVLSQVVGAYFGIEQEFYEYPWAELPSHNIYLQGGGVWEFLDDLGIEMPEVEDV